jgi:uncharacterized protein
VGTEQIMLSVILIAVLAALSLRVWTTIILRWRSGVPALEPLPRPSSPCLPLACGAAAVFVGLMIALIFWTTIQSPQASEEVTLSRVQQAVVEGTVHVILAVALLTCGGRVRLADCGISMRDLGRQLWDGVLGFLASVVPVMLMLLLTAWLRTPESQHPFLKLLQRESGAAEVVAWLLISAVMVAPIKEELIFRAMLQEGLARRLGASPAIGMTAILFCMVHGFPDALALLPLAIILGYVYDRRQSVLSVVVVHALFNLTNIVILLMNPEAPV